MDRAELRHEPSASVQFAIVWALGLAVVLSVGATSLFFGYIIAVAFRLVQAAIS